MKCFLLSSFLELTVRIGRLRFMFATVRIPGASGRIVHTGAPSLTLPNPRAQREADAEWLGRGRDTKNGIYNRKCPAKNQNDDGAEQGRRDLPTCRSGLGCVWYRSKRATIRTGELRSAIILLVPSMRTYSRPQGSCIVLYCFVSYCIELDCPRVLYPGRNNDGSLRHGRRQRP